MGGFTHGGNDAEVTPGDRLIALWRRIKQHRIAQWTVGYVAVAYAMQHAVILTSESYEWPKIVARVTMTLLALGLPIAMTLAWHHGGRVNRHASGGEMAVVSLMLVGLSLAFYIFLRPAAEIGTRAASASITASANANGISVAVLPFLNLAGDPKEDFFSDGMTEEITSALAKIPSLRVVGRTSAFQFKGKPQDLREIGRALSATHLIEGSVRKDGNEVRITAQLIKVDDGTHLWTENYDRELKGIFAVQEEIAQSIAGALRVPLGLKQGQTLVSNRNIGPDDYQQYLRALQLLRSVRSREAVSDAIVQLQQVIARNPEYAPAWSWLAIAYDALTQRTPSVRSGASGQTRQIVDQYFATEYAAAQRGVQLDPNLALGIATLGALDMRRGKLVSGEKFLLKALSIDPNQPETLQYYGNLLSGVGFLKQSLAVKQKAHISEPFVPYYNVSLAHILWLNGDNEGALAIATEERPDVDERPEVLSRIYAAMGRYNEAAGVLLTIAPDVYLPGTVDAAVQLLRGAPKSPSAPPTLPLGLLGFVHVYSGAPERVLENFEEEAHGGFLTPYLYSALWHSSYAAVRKTERFRKFARDAGMVEYWRARGWPEFCHPTAADDFECK